jgi:hypothetical protein
LGGTLCKIGSPLLSFLLCSLCTPLQCIGKSKKIADSWLCCSLLDSANGVTGQIRFCRKSQLGHILGLTFLTEFFPHEL